VGIWSHNNAEWVLMQLATARWAGAGQHQPGLPHGRGGIRAQQGGLQGAGDHGAFKTSDYLGMLRELAPELALPPGQLASVLPELRTVVWIDVAGRARSSPACCAFPI
jgi:fatty-acyl-CoA synthase